MATFDGDPVERSGMVAIFARWQRSALEHQHQVKIRDEAAKRADESMTSLTACREACRAFGIDPDNTDQLNRAFAVYGAEAAKIYNETKPEHLPAWIIPPPPPEPEPTSDVARIPAPTLETPSPPPMPRIKDIILEFLSVAHDIELGGSKAADIRGYIEQKYSTKIHEKTVGMTLYRLLKDKKVTRKGHLWFFVPQPADTKNPGATAPGLFEDQKEQNDVQPSQ